jgi:Predicted transcriptional regulators
MEKKRSDCPVSCSLDIFGDKWSLLIIRDVMMKGKVSYSEFLKADEKIATNILSNRLKLLEEEKLLVKEVSPTNKSKFDYYLTQKGADLLPVLVEMAVWGGKYNKNSHQSELYQRVKKAKRNF